MPQRFDRSSAEDVLLEDPLRALAIDAGVPDVIRIDDDPWPVAALVHAPRVIDADDALQPVFSRTLLQDFMHFLGALRGARFAGRADKHMMTILAQWIAKVRCGMWEGTFNFLWKLPSRSS